jgi:hypothetical protein
MRVLFALPVVLAQPLTGLYDPVPSAPVANATVTVSFTTTSSPSLDTTFTPLYTAPLQPMYTAPLAPQQDTWSSTSWETTISVDSALPQFDGTFAGAPFEASAVSEAWAGNENWGTTLSVDAQWSEPLLQDRYLSMGNSWDTAPIPVPVFTDSYAPISTNYPQAVTVPVHVYSDIGVPQYPPPAWNRPPTTAIPVPIWTDRGVPPPTTPIPVPIWTDRNVPPPQGPIPVPIWTDRSVYQPTGPIPIPIWTERGVPPGPVPIPVWSDRNVLQYGLHDPSEAHDPYRRYPSYSSRPPMVPPRSGSSWQHDYFREFSAPTRY